MINRFVLLVIEVVGLGFLGILTGSGRVPSWIPVIAMSLVSVGIMVTAFWNEIVLTMRIMDEIYKEE